MTVSLANGKTEAWVADRTGHRSSQMINTYRRTARTYAELNLGELVPKLVTSRRLGSRMTPQASYFRHPTALQRSSISTSDGDRSDAHAAPTHLQTQNPVLSALSRTALISGSHNDRTFIGSLVRCG